MKRFVFLLVFPLFVFCENPLIDVYEDSNKMSEKAGFAVKQYLSLSQGYSSIESILFFTDPHLLSADNKFNKDIQEGLINSFSVAKELYDTLHLDLCLCGGDWLNSGDTQRCAKEKLLFADAQMKMMFSPYYKMMGNHDTNYQGIVSDRDSSRGDLTKQFIDKEYFSETGSAYYTFNGHYSEFFILDSGLDWDTALNDYRVSQLFWLGSELKKSTSAHKIVGIHMFYNDVPDITPMAEELVALIEAFNSRGRYVIKDKEFDFSGSLGTIHFVLTGHCHVDFIEYINNLPIIGTCKFSKNSHPFDLIVINYDKGMVDMIRIGEGDNRSIKMFL